MTTTGKKARLVGINHVALEIGNIEAALDFHGAIFTFTLRGRSATMAFLDPWGNHIQVVEYQNIQFSKNRSSTRRNGPERSTKEQAGLAGIT